MGATKRLRDCLIDYTELYQALGGHSHRFGRCRCMVSRFPQDGRTALRGDDRIGRVLQHVQLVGNADGDCATGVSLPVTVAIKGVLTFDIIAIFSAIASLIPRSSESMPG